MPYFKRTVTRRLKVVVTNWRCKYPFLSQTLYLALQKNIYTLIKYTAKPSDEHYSISERKNHQAFKLLNAVCCVCRGNRALIPGSLAHKPYCSKHHLLNLHHLKFGPPVKSSFFPNELKPGGLETSG